MQQLLADRYQLTDVIGVGGMGTVHAAIDLRTGGTVAVKLLHQQFAADPTYVARLTREAQLAASIPSPRVVRMIDLGTHEGLPFLVMEYVPGPTLAEVLETRGALPLGDALTIALEITRALDAAYERGIIHRDLKPQNIKLVEGQIKVLDFGIARAEFDARLTVTGAYLGTPAYSAPECLGGRGDIRADIYSLGVIIFELLTGRLPFRGRTPLALLQEHATRAAPVLPGVALRSARDLVRRCLAKRAADRYQTPAELITALQVSLEELSVKFAASTGATLVGSTDSPRAASAGAGRSAATVDSASAAPVLGNVPEPSTSFVGRGRELVEVKRRLVTTRLLTLTSSGGCGKTRLAIQVARELHEHYADGVWYVELAALSEPSLVPQRVATALGVREQAERPLLETLIEHLAACHLLLILDNCEHLLGACAALADALLDGCSSLQILATSREILGASGEAIWRVPSLALPPRDQLPADSGGRMATLLQAEAVQLFVERMRAHAPAVDLTPATLHAIADICYQLDGMPLPLELIAALADTLPLETISAQIAERLHTAVGSTSEAVSREQRLRMILDWCYDALTGADQTVFRSLSVFAGTFGADAANSVCPEDPVAGFSLLPALQRLLARTLVTTSGATTPPRYQLLESLRQFGREKLQAGGEAQAVHARHRAWYLQLAEQAEPELTGPTQQARLQQLATEHDNLRAALAWSLLRGHEGPASLRLSGALWRFWLVRGHLREGHEWLTRALRQTDDADPQLQAKVLYGAGVLAWQQSNYSAAREHFEQYLHLVRALNDPLGIARALTSLGTLAWSEQDYTAAQERLDEALLLLQTHRPDDLRALAGLLNNLGTLASDSRNLRLAQTRHRESLALRRKRLEDARGVAQSYANLGEVAYRRGYPRRALVLYRRSLVRLHALHDKELALNALNGIARALTDLGEFTRALRLLTAEEYERTALRLPLPATFRADHDRALDELLTGLGQAQVSLIKEQATALSLDDAIEEALAVRH